MLPVWQAHGRLVLQRWRNPRLWRDSRIIVSNQKSVLTQFATTWFVARQVWTRMVKCATSLFNLFCSNVSKQVSRFVARFTGRTKKLMIIFTIVQTVALWHDQIHHKPSARYNNKFCTFFAFRIRRSSLSFISLVFSNTILFCARRYKSLLFCVVVRQQYKLNRNLSRVS